MCSLSRVIGLMAMTALNGSAGLTRPPRPTRPGLSRNMKTNHRTATPSWADVKTLETATFDVVGTTFEAVG
jgi:hypothetical protein